MMWLRQVKAIAAFPVVMAVVVPAAVLAVFGAGGGLVLEHSAKVVSIAVGVLLIVLGSALFCWTVVLFARQGKGALAPLGDTTRLVVSGPYRHVRNPMYTAVFSIQIGEALALRAWTLLIWFLCYFAFIASFVRVKEEPWLIRQFGADYDEYRAFVPRWIPRLTPWSPSHGPRVEGG